MLRPGLGWASATDPLHGRIDIPPLVLRLLRTPAVRRLDRLRQLPDLSISLPAATHTRLVHSLGVMHLAAAMFDRLRQLRQARRAWWDSLRLPEPTPELRTVVQVAGILHDVGHGPFSHAYEHILRRRFPNLAGVADRWARRRILEADGPWGIATVLAGARIPNLGAQVERVIRGLSPDLTKEHHFVGQIVSSELDADRLDYLPRDARFTGVGLGHVDPWGIIDRLMLARDAQGFVRLALPVEAEESARDVLYARQRAYERLYNCPAALCVQEMLLTLFDQALGGSGPTAERLAELAWMTDEGFLAALESSSPLAQDLLARLRSNCPYVLLPVCLGDPEAGLSEAATARVHRWRTPLSAADVAEHTAAVGQVSEAWLGSKGSSGGPWRAILVLEQGRRGSLDPPSAPWIVESASVAPRPIAMDAPATRNPAPVPIAVPEEAILGEGSTALFADASRVEDATATAVAHLQRIGLAGLYAAWSERLGGAVHLDEPALLRRTADWLVRGQWAGR